MLSAQIKNKTQPEKFPRLLHSEDSNRQGLIVLAYGPFHGVVINAGNSSFLVGEAIKTNDLVDFEGSITLSNK